MATIVAGEIVSRTFSPGFVVLSYVISYIGAITSLELINKRTSNRGLYNWALLISASISMGGISIWCMHFIGNRAIVLGGGVPSLRIAYNNGFTALSFFIPILVLLAAFTTIGSNERINILRVCISGTLAGCGICGMHYLGQAGIANYTCVYQVGNIIGAAIIAIAASIVALSVFFVLRVAWSNSWWKRALTSIILSGAVSGMHWTASVGTRYRLRKDVTQTPNPPMLMSNNSTVIVVIVLSITACFVLLSLSFITQKRRVQSADRAQRVLLAAVIFDNDGKLMVTTEGVLPTTKITDTYIERSFDDVFGISHPVFLWIFRLTRNWSSISTLLPSMRSHLHHVITAKGARPGTKSAELALVGDDGKPIEDYSIIFRELFCLAASELTTELRWPIEKAGILFDDIMNTGRETKGKPKKRVAGARRKDIESQGTLLPIIGRGQLLFLVQIASRRDVEHLQGAGFRFTNVDHVTNMLGRSMQINTKDLHHNFGLMREYASKSHILEPGVHVACFAIRASTRGRFDVMVRKDARNQLPTMQMPLTTLNGGHLEFLEVMDGWTLDACIRELKSKIQDNIQGAEEQKFAQQLHETFEALREEMQDGFIDDARLISKPMKAPCRPEEKEGRPGCAKLICFRIIIPVHIRVPSAKLDFVPLAFFKTEQFVFANSSDHAVFARKVHREFAPILTQAKNHFREQGSANSNTGHMLGIPTGRRDRVSQVSMVNDLTPAACKESRFAIHRLRPMCDAAVTSLWEKVRNNSSVAGIPTSKLNNKHGTQESKFGGIMVSQEVTVDTTRAPSPTLNEHGVEMVPLTRKAVDGSERKLLRMGTMGLATKEDEDPQSYVDQLFVICAGRGETNYTPSFDAWISTHA